MLIGREDVLERLAVQLESPGGALVWGELGAGKTAALRAAATACGRRVFAGGGLLQLRWESYLPFMRALGLRLPGADPEAVAGFTAEVVDEGVLVLDDLHCADGDTLAALALLTGRIRVLAAARAGEPLSRAALGAGVEAGMSVIELAPLSEAAAGELVRARNPRLGEPQQVEIVSAGGGNPLFLEQMAIGGAVTATLARAIDVRLDALSESGRLALATIALRGQPCELAALPAPAVDELVAARLALASGERLSLRQPALGERAVSRLTAVARRELHARLAAALAHPGERARHEAAAGLREAARGSALAAAQSTIDAPLERARHLVLAAACTDDPAPAAELRTAAAAAMLEGGDMVRARALAEGVPLESAAGVRARVILARAANSLGEPGDAARAAAEALQALGARPADPSATEVGLALKLELLLADGGSLAPAALIEAARECLREADRLSANRAWALHVLGTAELLTSRPQWRATLAESIEAANRAGDATAELLGGQTLVVASLGRGGDASLGPQIAAYEQRARELRRRGWELQFAAARLWFTLALGGSSGAVEREAVQLLDTRAIPRLRDQLEATLALSLADRGAEHLGEARRRVVAGLERAPSAGRGLLRWVAAEIEWLRGGERASELAGECLEHHRTSAPVGALAAVTAAWAAREAGREVGPWPAVEPYGGAEVEQAAIGAPDPGLALDGFRAAQAGWAEVQLRGRMRCRWGEAEALRSKGRPADGVAVLDALAQELEERGMFALTARVSRSRRASGQPPAAGRSADRSGLSSTERTVMSLAAAGMTNLEIAAFLRLAASTVETHIDHVKEKLGAANRKQAVARFIGTRAPEPPRTGEAPPLVVLHDERALPDLRTALERDGWSLGAGFPHLDEPWPLAGARRVFVGAAGSEDERARALRAGARGAGLVILDAPEDAGFVEDLARLGPVTVYAPGDLTPRMRLLLRAQANGSAVGAAARSLFISEASAYRTMREACRILGVSTNTEAVAAFEERFGSDSLI